MNHCCLVVPLRLGVTAVSGMAPARVSASATEVCSRVRTVQSLCKSVLCVIIWCWSGWVPLLAHSQPACSHVVWLLC